MKLKTVDKIIVFLVFALFSLSMFAECRGDLQEKWFVRTTILTAVDYSQTMHIVKDDRFKERGILINKIYGKNLSKGDIQKFFIGRTLGQYALQCYAPPWASRYFFIGGTIGVGSVVVNNYSLGVRFKF